ncbi:protein MICRORCHIDIA 6-like isoform X1 [Benincasa hispida]|uniref:protein MICRORCHIDIA 6-like isoform X1 n=1 Tax=Benincasa hispida TaxID=102211 RepID=UPI001901EDA8|nr:protein MICRORCHIDIA 6-like isoform X1 [Benincasa hispida]XP_038879003.1 protein MICRORCHIDIA 6-like isoform X1 [Benincasa hispida]XP_038879004.1 protein MICRORCHIDIA 6-like isoform X1 [Benincasa hispida]XP_038879005.1 protein MICRORCHIDIA 6-like isoform X1 [Benincasa hispida]XP_038879006.1 protein MICRORCHIDIA 6-like isoform X1 [Benincasa hispida]XP_038879007.1 protein MICRORCHIDIA 6-like isoform X1 [Benincasa hispida]XP_038879008.1 protein MICRORCHIDIA 6-like isoform X1 [Benincasa hispid
MISADIVDLSSDDEEGSNLKAVKLEPGVDRAVVLPKEHTKKNIIKLEKPNTEFASQGFDENRSPNVWSAGQSSSSILDQVPSPADDSGLTSPSPLCPAPVCRQFWKAGNYNDEVASNVTVQSSKGHLHVHPMFLHSNATSHKWAFGAVAELLDNAVDEIPNGATFVNVDKILNARDGSPALLIQDDGGGMDPEAMRRCMSFGFSDKSSKSAIGQYGNGFKTSTMRLGADVIVFSRHVNNRSRVSTQSIGLLSYTFLTRSGYNRIVVPMVDYKYNTSSGKMEILHGRERFMSNLSTLIQWSPYSSESELLKQFDDIGSHGTKVIIYNFWYNGDGRMELDFDKDPEDICIDGDVKKIVALPASKAINEQHIANRLQYSLREYLSILYLRMSENFKIVLRGTVVLHRNLADDLKYLEYILYKPQIGGHVEGVVVTTIGFLKEAPDVNIHGFNVYHKNRLILPFWRVVSYSDSRGRGVVGVLEANFIEPTHNKQDFERTSIFQKLEARLKDMTWEYWDYHCGLVGYQVKKQLRVTAASKTPSNITVSAGTEHPHMLKQCFPATVTEAKETAHGRPEQFTLEIPGKSREGVCMKRERQMF